MVTLGMPYSYIKLSCNRYGNWNMLKKTNEIGKPDTFIQLIQQDSLFHSIPCPHESRPLECKMFLPKQHEQNHSTTNIFGTWFMIWFEQANMLQYIHCRGLIDHFGVFRDLKTPSSSSSSYTYDTSEKHKTSFLVNSKLSNLSLLRKTRTCYK